MPAGHQNVDRVISQECSAKQLALSANEPTCGGGELRVYEEAVPALNIMMTMVIIIIFYMRHNIIGGRNYKYRKAAPLYTQETWTVSGKYPFKRDKYNNNNNNNNKVNLALHLTLFECVTPRGEANGSRESG